MPRPLMPMTTARIAWETDVMHELCVIAECCNGDAQGIAECRQDLCDRLFEERTDPKVAAQRLLDATDDEIF